MLARSTARISRSCALLPACSGALRPTAGAHSAVRRTTHIRASTAKPETAEAATLKSEFLQTLKWRGFIQQATDVEALDALLAEKTVVAYLGFDATASSLHVGSLLQIMLLRHFQRCGHKPLVLVGGGTTKVGDPSGKDASRQLLTQEAIDKNIDGISQVFSRFLTFGDGPTDAVLVNNDDWLSPLKYLEFLRDYGRHFTINRMLSFESVKQRLERESPLSFLEFNYMILQAYDFLELHRREGAVLQFGGSDQWGNIINGVELGRRVDGASLYGLTAPLLATADGKKMGKTASGAVWLNEELLSPFEYWQFWRNTADSDVGRFLRIFTELPQGEIEKLESLSGAAVNDAKVVLANEATRMLHGAECLEQIQQTAASLFGGGGAGGAGDTEALPRVKVSSSDLAEGVPLIDLFLRLELGKSKSEIRRLVTGGGAKLNDVKVEDAALLVTPETFAGREMGEIKLSAGKKKHGIVELV
uniref:Tyrosine--tRNA ligase n=1 Tax=Coccolithus braarudii TaxID=221442 RepID=A0A7S0LKU6_9EUKA